MILDTNIHTCTVFALLLLVEHQAAADSRIRRQIFVRRKSAEKIRIGLFDFFSFLLKEKATLFASSDSFPVRCIRFAAIHTLHTDRQTTDDKWTNRPNLFIRPPGTVVPGGLMFCCGFFLSFFVALCGAISPRWLGRSTRNFHT